MEYKAIGFDYGGVIVGKPAFYFDFAICKILDIDHDTFKRMYFSNNHLMNIKGMSYKDLWKKILIELKKTEKENELFNFLQTQPYKDINQDIIDLIKVLREKGYKTGILSNNSTKVNDKIKNFGIDKFFDVTVISEDIGYMKPDPKAYEIFCEKLNIKSEELVFIDDTEIYLSTSSKVGLTPILFKNIEDLKVRLKELDVL